MNKKTSKLLIFVIYLILAIAGMLLGVFLNGNFSVDAPMVIVWVLSILPLIISIIVSLVKRKATGFFKVVFTIFLITSMYIVGIGVDGAYKAKYVEPKLRAAKLEEYRKMGMTAENTKITLNENGVKIYGKKLSESEPMYNKMRDPAQEERGVEKGITWTYTQYFSEAYGEMVYIKTNNKSGYQEVYNEDGQRFLSGEAKYELEQTLAKYKAGNIIAEKIDAKYRNKK